jgi:hypothetical protein
MILTTIWRDPEFGALRPAAKLVYLMLLSQPDVNHLGVLPLVPGRWARLVGYPPEAMTECLTELDQARFLVVDPDAQQVLIRTLLRNDGIVRQPNVLRAALAAVSTLASRRIATALLDEVSRVRAEEGNDKIQHTLDEMKALLETLGEPFPEPFAEPFPEPFAMTTKKGSKNPSGNPLGDRGKGLEVTEEVAVPARARATRVPDPFPVTPEMVAWAMETCPKVNGKRETEKFVDYWRGKSGAGGTKLDWPATWRNWMRTANERLPDRVSPVQPLSTGEQRAAAAIEAGRRLEERMRGNGERPGDR